MMGGQALNFLGLPDRFSAENTSRFTVLPVPYEQTTTYIMGTAQGPTAILEASQQVEFYDEELDCEPYTNGIYTTPEFMLDPSPEKAVDTMHRRVSNILQSGKIPVTLGGEHTVTIGPVRACADRYPDMSVLQLDAHADLRDEYMDSQFNHACTVRRLLEYAPVVQVGIRSLSREEAELITERTLPVFYAHRINNTKPWDDIVSALSDHVYVTIDLDVFDSGIMPSAGTPEPGGLGWYDVLTLVRSVARSRTIIGFDVVELCPQPGNIAPDFLAAKLVYKVMGYITTGKTEQYKNSKSK